MEMKFVLPPLTAQELGAVLAALSHIERLELESGIIDGINGQVYRKIDDEKSIVGFPV